MRRTTWQQIGAGAMAALLAAGCATGNPQRRPETTNQTMQGSTTGNLDQCSLALGNVPAGGTGATAAGTVAGAPLGNTGGLTEATANGIMIGNVALVALPDYDHMPLSNPPGVAGPPNGAPTTLGTPTIPGRPDSVYISGIPSNNEGGAGGATTPNATNGYTGTLVPPGPMGVADGGLPGTGAGLGTAGMTGTAGTTGNTNRTGGPTALDRIRANCAAVSEIRVVTEPADKARLAELATSMRRGVPVTVYMDEIARITGRATLAGGGGGGTASPGQVTPGTRDFPAIP